MKALLYATLVLGLVAGSVQAGTVLVVSDCQVPGVAGGDHNDDSLVTFLQGLGHTVDTYGMNKLMQGVWDTTDQDHADDADLIIVSRRTNSGAYNNGPQWNGQATPLLSQSGYLTRDSRWDWTTGGSGDVTKTETDMAIKAGQTGHFSLTAVHTITGPVALFDWSGVPAGDNQAPKGVYNPLETDCDVAGTILVGTMNQAPTALRGMLLELPQGTDTGNGVLGAQRVFFSHWGYDDPTTGVNGPGGTPSEWEDYITQDYENVMENIISTMIPEPATLTLLAAGVVATLIRRKK